MAEITVLKSLGIPLCKRFEGNDKHPYPTNVKRFWAQIEHVSNIHDLSKLLTHLEQDEPNACIIRGSLIDGVDLNRPILRRLRRKEDEDLNSSPIVDLAQPWIMVDVDKLPLPDGMDLIANTEQAIVFTIAQLPAELHKCSCHWQLSNSAGTADTNSISIHLYFWLSQPVANDILKSRWALPHNSVFGVKLIDAALFNAAQIHYVAKPIFEGREDPFATGRSGFIQGEVDSATLLLHEPIQYPSANVELYTSSSGILPVGYEAKMQMLGDGEGCSGFNDVLISATAAYAYAHGATRTLASKKALKADLRHRIREADQSNHSLDEIKRYLSDSYLDYCIDSAVEKFGGNDRNIPPHWDKPLLTLAEGQDALNRAVAEFGEAVKAYLEDPLMNERPVHVIKATAGLGKTRAVIKDLLNYNLLEKGDVHYFVPNHKLSQELLADLNETLSLDIKDTDGTDAVFERARIIYGRSGIPNSGEQYCKKNKLVETVSGLGLNVMTTLCKSGSAKCEFYDDCPYIAQFDDPPEIPLEMIPVLSEVKVLTHDHLFLRAKDRFMSPSLTVIDESFVKSASTTQSLNITELTRLNKQYKIARMVGEFASEDKPHLLYHLRTSYSADEVMDEAVAIEAEYDNAISSLKPNLPQAQQEKALKGAKAKTFIPTLLHTLAEEMRLTSRSESNAITWDESQVHILKRKDIFTDIHSPILIIDADADELILKKFLPDIKVTSIDVDRQAEVYQFYDRTFSKASLTDQHSEPKIEDIKDFISKVAANDTPTLVVCSREIRMLITGEKITTGHGEYAGATVVHFNSIRGLNTFSDYENVIIIGREQPSSTGAEASARGIFWDDEEPIQRLGNKSGSRPFSNDTRRGYRLASGEYDSTTVQLHPDHRVQAMVEQIRESESTQAIDRLRLLRPHPEGKQRRVFILSSVPLDITVDHLLSWDALQRSLALIREADGFLPLNKTHLAERCPSVGSERTAKKRIAELKRARVLIEYLIRDDVLYSVKYKASGSSAKKSSEAWVFDESYLEMREVNVGKHTLVLIA
jgi:hypothetical protein